MLNKEGGGGGSAPTTLKSSTKITPQLCLDERRKKIDYPSTRRNSPMEDNKRALESIRDKAILCLALGI